jgi:hypothetical protein
LRLVGKEGDLVLGDRGNKVDEPDDEVADTGKKTYKTYNEGKSVLGFGELNNSVDTAYNVTEEELDKYLSDLGEVIVRSGK